MLLFKAPPVLVFALAIASPSVHVTAGETVSTTAPLEASADSWAILTTNAPPETGSILPYMRRVVELFDAVTQTRLQAAQLRDQRAEVRLGQVEANTALDMAMDEWTALGRRLAEYERRGRERLESLRGELETAFNARVAAAAQRNTQELHRGVAVRLQQFDAIQREAKEKTLDEEFRLKERQLERLRQEIDLQSRQFLDRLDQAGKNIAVSQAIQRDMTQTLAQRKTEFEEKRHQLNAERDAFAAAQRSEFIGRVAQELRAEHKQRLRLQEAEFRTELVQLLQQTNREQIDQLLEIHQHFDRATQRYSQALQYCALWEARSEALNQQLAARIHRVDELEIARTTALAKLEEALQASALSERRPVLFAWFSKAVERLPADIETELEWLRRRVEQRVANVQQTEAQRRMVRDRQMALQISRELEVRYQRARVKQQQEQQVRARKAQELLARVEPLEHRGQLDEAIKLVSQAQELDPGCAGTAVLVRRRLIAARDQAVRRAQSEQLEQMFARAMDLFKQQHYDEAVVLFQQVVAQERLLQSSPTSRLELGNR